MYVNVRSEKRHVSTRLWSEREETPASRKPKAKSISVLVGAQIPSSPSGISEREILAPRFQVYTSEKCQ